jgi:hypothetical protein
LAEKKLIDRLEATDPTATGWVTKLKHRALMMQLLREMLNRIEALEQELLRSKAGYPGYD